MFASTSGISDKLLAEHHGRAMVSNTSTGTLEALLGNIFKPMPSPMLVAPRGHRRTDGR